MKLDSAPQGIPALPPLLTGRRAIVTGAARGIGKAVADAFAAAGATVVRLADSVSGELAPRGSRVNTISPGSVDTEMVAATTAEVARQTGTTPEAVRASYEAAIPMGRFAQPSELASVAVALCSGLCSYV